MNTLKRKYGFVTATSMIVGIVIGSAIFIKSGSVLKESGGNIWISLLAWLVGGLIMIFNSIAFSTITVRLKESNGLVGYVSNLNSEKSGYYIGWYMSTIYLPIITSVIAYFSSDYLMKLFGIVPTSLLRIIIPITLLITLFILNIIAPKISAKFQVSTTIIKLVPILLIILLAIYIKIRGSNYVDTTIIAVGYEVNFFRALLITCFAYEGWIVSTTIHSEINNPDKNLPKALLLGSAAVVLIYLIYNFSISLAIGTDQVINQDTLAPVFAFNQIFGDKAQFILTLFLFISCLGTLNGVTMGTSRAFYSLSNNRYMYKKDKLSVINQKFNIPALSAIIGLTISIVYVFIAYLAFEKGLLNPNYDSIVCAFIYISYIPLYLSIIKNFKDVNIFSRFISPIIAIIGSLFFIFVAFYELIGGILSDSIITLRIPFIIILIGLSFSIAYILKRKSA